MLSLLYSRVLLCAAVACSGLPHNREGAPRTRDCLTTSLSLSGRACGRFLLLLRCWSWYLLVSLLYSLLLLCAAVACSGLPDNRDGAPRARDNLATSCFFFGSGREGALANAPRRERFSTKKDGELSWHPRGKNARLVRTAGRLEPAGATPGGPRASSRERLDRASSPAWRWRARGPRSRASWTGCR